MASQKQCERLAALCHADPQLREHLLELAREWIAMAERDTVGRGLGSHDRHPAASTQGPYVDYRFVRRSRRRAGGHRLHRGYVVAITTHRQAAAAGGVVKTIGENEVRD